MSTSWLYRRDEPAPLAVLQRIDDFGLEALDLVRPPGRFWADGAQPPPVVDIRVDSRRVRSMSSPASLLRGLPEGETWRGTSRRSLARLNAWFLVCEDPQRRLEAQAIVTLAHQASLVQHVVQEPSLKRVLIADEVGLGKTVEAGLLVRELLARQPGLRVLYFAPARLVSNVRREFDRLNLAFRSWVAGAERDATLDDRRIIASIHRASHPAHFEPVTLTPPWDVIIVDECHHLSDWAKGGGSPVRKLKLVQELVKRLRPGGRVILLSGTPHQGSPVRFENLLQLLREDAEPDDALAGRVIYRTKEDVHDWDGNPLFPRRQVNAPLILDVGHALRRWLVNIHELFETGATGGLDDVAGNGGAGQARRRAAGWRAGMALQWATSSVQAGLGYLVRQAIRAGWRHDDAPLDAALASLRPYRGGSLDEPIASLFDRMGGEIQQQDDAGDVDDIEDASEGPEGPGPWKPDRQRLAAVLEEGVSLLRTSPDAKWRFIHEQILKDVGDEKVVLFAQPIETVTALAGYLERETGRAPALIVGNQRDSDRQREIAAFWRPDGPQFLVSSRAGGEGLNLQVSRRLVHVDVPWNPMELEQRVGRVHRFRSKRTVIVDTVVVKDSREVDAYRIARTKLIEIASTLVAEDRFEALFSRVMALVPPEELQDILNDRPTSPFTNEESDRLQELVVRGFSQWRDFDGRFKERHNRIRELDPGQASWRDLERFARQHLGAMPAPGFAALRFRWQEGEVVDASEDAVVLQVQGRPFACGDYGGMPVTDTGGAPAEQLGLNVPEVVAELRKQAFPDGATGAAHLRWPERESLPLEGLGRLFGILAFARQTVRAEADGWLETGAGLFLFVVDPRGASRPIEGAEKGRVIRTLMDTSIRLEPETAPELVHQLVSEEERLLQELRRPTDTERDERIRHAVTPLLAAVVVVGRGSPEEECQ